jgi:uncharacterized membrane protein
MKFDKLFIVQIMIMIVLISLVFYFGRFYFIETNNYKISHEHLENSVYRHEETVNNYISLKEGLENENQ